MPRKSYKHNLKLIVTFGEDKTIVKAVPSKIILLMVNDIYIVQAG